MNRRKLLQSILGGAAATSVDPTKLAAAAVGSEPVAGVLAAVAAGVPTIDILRKLLGGYNGKNVVEMVSDRACLVKVVESYWTPDSRKRAVRYRTLPAPRRMPNRHGWTTGRFCNPAMRL